MKRLEHCNGFSVPIGCSYIAQFFSSIFKFLPEQLNARQDNNYDVMMIYISAKKLRIQVNFFRLISFQVGLQDDPKCLTKRSRSKFNLCLKNGSYLFFLQEMFDQNNPLRGRVTISRKLHSLCNHFPMYKVSTVMNYFAESPL